MASPAPDNPSTSAQDSSKSSSASTSKPLKGPEQGEDLTAWAMANMNDPAWGLAHLNDRPHREKPVRMLGAWPLHHGGPIRITAKDGVLTEYGEKLEQERREKLAARASADEKVEGKGKEAEGKSSS